MVTSIIESVRDHLGRRPLEKVDPNTQEINHAETTSPRQKLTQAAVPAVLAAMIKYSDGEEGLNLLSNTGDKNWLETIYGGKQNDAVAKVSQYAGVSNEEARAEMETVAAEAVRVVRDTVKTQDAEKLRSFMNSQRHSILSHLPAAMQMGDTLNEETFDDRTNKMEGPVSSFMHKIEDIL